MSGIVLVSVVLVVLVSPLLLLVVLVSPYPLVLVHSSSMLQIRFEICYDRCHNPPTPCLPSTYY